MPGQRPILAMSFVASLGITFEILSCTLPKGQSNFWPLLIYLVYLILPIPTILFKRMTSNALGSLSDSGVKSIRDYAIFFTAGIMMSSVALPIVLARSPVAKPVIAPLSCFLLEIGNLLCLTTIALFCMYFKPMKN